MVLSGFLRTIPVSLEQGLAYGLVALGIVISFRILAFPDLTVDGSFPLGAAVVARLIIEGVSPLTSIFIAMAAGFMAGCFTGILNTKLKINSLLAGILVMTVLYSVNLRIMGRSNIQLLTVKTFLTPLENLPINRFIPIILFFFLVAVGLKILLDLFFHTQIGFAMRATGDNEQMIRSLGVNTDTMTILGLGISNAFVALSGALVAQDQGFADVGMGIGMIVAGLASIIIGEALIGKVSVPRKTLAALMGSIIYKFIISVGLRMGLAPTDLKLATGIMVILALGIPALKKEKEGKLHLRGV
ncbi:MAG: ABC transporter permease [Deltaproteobacteria bacterium]|nr:ABC transporter permease [Deltaproteobacteria bacterium]MBW2016458.1 ABC transporter permease [Deltaproteobacteria bacterium]MBW2130389.1 ABC transporter permease [Deltaproteobacteria bacterium]MBW2304485.1 ABC transporter permease [Deltaproteobacteria bacterium]